MKTTKYSETIKKLAEELYGKSLDEIKQRVACMTSEESNWELGCDYEAAFIGVFYQMSLMSR